LDSKDKRLAVKKMAELLRSGAVMLPQKCPAKDCSLPLFKLKSGEIICPLHGRVYLVSSDEEAREIVSRLSVSSILDKLEKRVIEILGKTLDDRMGEMDYRDIIGWLEVLERITRIKKELESKETR